jgi:hypothetical protein
MKPAVFITLLFVAFFSYAGSNEPTALLDETGLLKRDKDKKRTNLRADRPIGVNLTGFGPGGLVSASIDGFLTPKFALEGGAGLRNEDGDLSYFLGGRYHLLGGTKLRLTPYVGVYTAFHNNERDIQNHALYVPIGLHKVKKNGFNWAIEAAYERNTFKEGNWTGAFKIGYRF